MRGRARQDGVDVRAGRGRILSAQGIVGPRLQDEDVDLLTKEPVHPAERPRRGLAAHAGVNDAIGQAGLLDALLEQARVGQVRIGQAVSGGETRAHREHHAPVRDGAWGDGHGPIRGRGLAGGPAAAGQGGDEGQAETPGARGRYHRRMRAPRPQLLTRDPRQ